MKGIMFKEELFPLVVDGAKTQTRRTIKGYADDHIKENGRIVFEHWKAKPRYNKGETIYLKEPYSFSMPFVNKNGKVQQIDIYYPYEPHSISTMYPQDLIFEDKLIEGTKTKMFMPEKYARHRIKITEVWAERLKDISEQDAIKEGVDWVNDVRKGKLYKNYLNGRYSLSSAVKSYLTLWETVNGAIFVKENPLVWCYQFKRKTRIKKQLIQIT